MGIYSSKCKLCDTPLTGNEQFMGHMIHSHDMKLEESAYAWKMTNSRLEKIASAGG